MSTLRYQSLVLAAGMQFVCVESYDSVFERLRESTFRMEDADSMRWAAPIELTCRGEHGPIRLALSLQAIAGVSELHESDRAEVES